MKKSSKDNTSRNRTRRTILMAGLFALCYPLLRFIGYRIPRKPRKIEVNQKKPTNGTISLKELILFDKNDKVWAVSRKCTHLGCSLQYHELDNYLECPCHQSRFTPEGFVIKGPAKRNLEVYEVEKRATAPHYIVSL